MQLDTATRGIMHMLILLALLALAWSPLFGATFTETNLQCDQEFTVRWADDKHTQIFVGVQCVTLDTAGNVIRGRREYNVFSRLTGAQQSGALAILNALRDYAATTLAIPTPTPTPTTTARTPTPTPSVTATP